MNISNNQTVIRAGVNIFNENIVPQLNSMQAKVIAFAMTVFVIIGVSFALHYFFGNRKVTDKAKEGAEKTGIEENKVQFPQAKQDTPESEKNPQATKEIDKQTQTKEENRKEKKQNAAEQREIELSSDETIGTLKRELGQDFFGNRKVTDNAKEGAEKTGIEEENKVQFPQAKQNTPEAEKNPQAIKEIDKQTQTNEEDRKETKQNAAEQREIQLSPDETIGTLKRKLERASRTAAIRFEILFDNEKLQDASTLKDLIVDDEEEEPGYCQAFCKNWRGKYITLEINRNWKVITLKRKIVADPRFDFQFSNTDFRISGDGRRLENDNMTLNDYGIQRECTFSLDRILRGD